MVNYERLICTRSDDLVTLLKFLLCVNGIGHIVENEHVVYYNPEREMCIKVEEEKLQKAKTLLEELPRRLQEVEVA